MTIKLLKNAPLYEGWYRADIGRLMVKIPNASTYVSAGMDGDKIVLLISTKPRAEMLSVTKTTNGYLNVNMFNFRHILPDKNKNVILNAKGYDIDNDAYVYHIQFM